VVWEYLASTEGMASVVSPQEALERPGTLGRPEDVRILDAQGNAVRPGEIGTIYFFSGSAPFEYHNDPEKTARAVRPDGYATAGDLGHLDEDGYLYLADRREDLIISGGVNIYPAEVEQRLEEHPAVVDVAVVGVPDTDWGASVVAIIQLEPGTSIDAELKTDLDRHCRETLASLKCPRRYEFRAELPRTPAGKLLRRAIREDLAGQETAAAG
jgi:long-chain acyl-CoA synthetase